MGRDRSEGEPYVFVLWSQARREERRILADLRARFTVLDTVEVVWTRGDSFARSLTRMYGSALPPGSDKELHCGDGPFLVVVVEDPHPRRRPRRTNHGVRLLNSAVIDARLRYRNWTGGGYRVHASDSVEETERNLVLLFGRTSATFRGASPPLVPRRYASDPVGTDGWASLDELVLALVTYGCHVDAPATAEHVLVVTAEDLWWAEHIAGGREVEAGVREVLVDGRPVRLTLREEPGAGTGSPARAATALLRPSKLAYGSPKTTMAVQGVAVVTTVVARSLLPARFRPAGTPAVLLASMGSYVVLRVGIRTGWPKTFKHEVMDRIGGDVDDAHTWILATLSGGAFLALFQVARRAVADEARNGA